MTDNDSSNALDRKTDRLLEILKGYGSVAIGFSAGVDSTVLTAAACKALSNNVVAFTAVSPSQPGRDAELAKTLAARIGVELILIETCELDDPRYQRNDPQRCYWCKQSIFGQIGKHPRGTVETITPRTIRLRLEDGSAHFVPLEELMKEKIRIGIKAPAAAAATQ